MKTSSDLSKLFREVNEKKTKSYSLYFDQFLMYKKLRKKIANYFLNFLNINSKYSPKSIEILFVFYT